MRDLDTLFRLHGAMVYRRARRLLGNQADAEDATQEIFARAIDGARNAPDGVSVSAWFYRVTTNHCLNVIRDAARRRELLRERGAELVDAAGAAPAPAELATLRALLGRADARQAEAAVAVYLDGMSYREAAVVMNVSARTVGNLIERFELWAQGQVAEPAGAPRPEGVGR